MATCAAQRQRDIKKKGKKTVCVTFNSCATVTLLMSFHEMVECAIQAANWTPLPCSSTPHPPPIPSSPPPPPPHYRVASPCALCHQDKFELRVKERPCTATRHTPLCCRANTIEAPIPCTHIKQHLPPPSRVPTGTSSRAKRAHTLQSFELKSPFMMQCTCATLYYRFYLNKCKRKIAAQHGVALGILVFYFLWAASRKPPSSSSSTSPSPAACMPSKAFFTALVATSKTLSPASRRVRE